MIQAPQLRELPWGRPLEEGKLVERKPLIRTLDSLPAMRISSQRTTPTEEKPNRVATILSQERSTVS